MLDPNTQNNITKKRGILLTTFLIIIIAALAIVFLSSFLPGFKPLRNPKVPLWVFYSTGAGAILYFISAIYIWRWKKWAIVFFCITAIALSIINILGNSQETIGVNPFVSLIVASILVLLAIPKWKMFDKY